MNKHVKIALCLPWYNGADRDCNASMLAFQHYLGRLQERSWFHAYADDGGYELPLLDPYGKDVLAEFPKELRGTTFEFGISDETACSLPGMARERCVDEALTWGADYIFFYDDDMQFPNSAFLRLFLDDKPVVAALAFTSREPITPVIYSYQGSYRKDDARVTVDIAPVFDYKPDTLRQVDAVGSGVLLIQADVFRRIPKPWFNSPGIGEDIFFCLRCREAGIPVHVDTRVKTRHKPTFHRASDWHDETKYNRDRLLIEFAQVRSKPSDIGPHLNVLYKYALGLDHVTEFGTDDGTSATAFLAAKPGAFRSYDINRTPAIDRLASLAAGAGVDFRFHHQSTLESVIEPTDLLFIDDLHTYEQVRQELALHAGKVRKFIFGHDTALFGDKDQLVVDQQEPGPGIRLAYDQFLAEHPEWEICHDSPDCNGLLGLRRVA